jgi:hypothetical protein
MAEPGEASGLADPAPDAGSIETPAHPQIERDVTLMGAELGVAIAGVAGALQPDPAAPGPF